MTEQTDPLRRLTQASRHLFLSPHFDDIALSAGATVARLAELDRHPETIVVFGTEPDPVEPLSPFAEAMHLGWGLSATDVVASRRREEETAAAILGARTRTLPFRDAIYRGWTYRSDDELFGSPAATEEPLPDAIIGALALGDSPDPAVRLYAPLAVGRHVDHQIVFRAAARLAAAGWDIWFYEDTPYVLKLGALRERLLEIGPSALEEAAHIPAGSAWDRKLDAILSYPSQLETIFRRYLGVGTSRQEIAAALTGDAPLSGDGEVVERFWRLKEAPVQPGS